MSTTRIIVVALFVVTVAVAAIVWDAGQEVVLKARLGKNYEGPLAGW